MGKDTSSVFTMVRVRRGWIPVHVPGLVWVQLSAGIKGGSLRAFFVNMHRCRKKGKGEWSGLKVLNSPAKTGWIFFILAQGHF